MYKIVNTILEHMYN